MESREGYVYLVRPIGHNVYKIGCTVDPDERLRRMQRKHRGFQLEYAALVHHWNYFAFEDFLHRKFSRYRLIGEWFVLPDEAVEEFKGLSS